MRRTCHAAAARLLVACLAAPAANAKQACMARIEGGKTIESARNALACRTAPLKVAVGKPFAVDLIVCRTDAGAKIEELRWPELRSAMQRKPAPARG